MYTSLGPFTLIPVMEGPHFQKASEDHDPTTSTLKRTVGEKTLTYTFVVSGLTDKQRADAFERFVAEETGLAPKPQGREIPITTHEI